MTPAVSPTRTTRRSGGARVALLRLIADSHGRIGYRQVSHTDLPSSFQVDDRQWTPCGEPGELPQSGRTLLASSQGDSTFSLFRISRSGLRHEKTFRIADSPAIDSVEHSDTPAVEPRPNTNFKLLRWEQVAI